MKNIAVFINGSSKYLDLTHTLFEHWNKLYDDINFDFYLSTWEDNIDYAFQEEDNFYDGPYAYALRGLVGINNKLTEKIKQVLGDLY